MSADFFEDAEILPNLSENTSERITVERNTSEKITSEKNPENVDTTQEVNLVIKPEEIGETVRVIIEPTLPEACPQEACPQEACPQEASLEEACPQEANSVSEYFEKNSCTCNSLKPDEISLFCSEC